jgi:hypothetical protein
MKKLSHSVIIVKEKFDLTTKATALVVLTALLLPMFLL